MMSYCEYTKTRTDIVNMRDEYLDWIVIYRKQGAEYIIKINMGVQKHDFYQSVKRFP